MRILKIVLSVLALAVIGLQYAATNGMWDLSPSVISIVVAAAGFLGVLGVQPLPIPDQVARILGALGGMFSTIMAVHAGNVSRAANPHPFVWATVGAIGVALAILGRLPVPQKAAPPVEPGR